MSKIRVFAIKFLYKIARPIQVLYWFITKPQTRGVKTLIQFEDKFLLVKLTYAHKAWTIPGGGVKRNESFEEAGKREVFEEVGIKLDNIKKIGSYFNIVEHKRDTVEVYYAKVDSSYFKIDPVEIEEAQWYKKEELPYMRKQRVDIILGMLKNEGI